MDFVVEETDRLSSLPLDLIHHILSFTDMKYAVQTCVLSSKWKLIWTSLRHINFSTQSFDMLGQFSRFARHVIAHRNHETDVHSLDLTFSGTLSQILIKVILNYVLSHNIHRLTIYCTDERDRKLPLSIFESQSLKYFSLRISPQDDCIIPEFPWVLPNLTTLHLNQIVFHDRRTKDCLDLFSTCVNLKNLTLNECCLSELEVFNVSAPRLSSLILLYCIQGPSIFNIFAPELEILSIKHCLFRKLVISAPVLSSFGYEGHYPLLLSTNGLQNLDKVDLYMRIPCPNSTFNEEDAHQLIKLLKDFHYAKFLNLCSDVIESLAFYPDVLSSQPSPFCNLKCLKIHELSQKENYIKFMMPDYVRSYLLGSSPSATIVMELLK